ncbi:uncharacterized protein LOC130662970 [Microplitis mediator]|uniref:uncharacterized protein LOC130662970 n=1 Tax=Microplitis mediator TaxID=375433 RepID=UPI00255389D5|nr:uncharacterized protein LOC130662970 [Microplitis mediator]
MPFNNDQLRYKGRFVKKKVLEKRTKAIVAMNNAKKLKTQSLKTVCRGRRIVELQELGKNLKCRLCSKVLSLEKITHEKRMGLNSILNVKCEDCNVITLVPTGKTHLTRSEVKQSDVNTKAVLGAVHSGFGCTALNKLLASMNIPPISWSLYKKYEREIGPAIEEAARDSCSHSAAEKRQLIIDKLDEMKAKL